MGNCIEKCKSGSCKSCDFRPKWAVVGGGNGGQAMAGHLALMNFNVKLYDIIPEKIQAINDNGGINVGGVVKGLGKPDLVTTDIAKAVKDADVIMVVAPAFAHKNIAKACSPYLTDGQIIVLNPGSTGGVFEFIKVLKDEGCTAKVTVAETQTLIYTCRSDSFGHVNVFAIKKGVGVAALPANKTDKVVEILNTAFGEFKPAKNIIATSLENINSVVHPTPILLNLARVDNGTDFLYYFDGVSPVIASFLEKLDEERMKIGKAFGLDLTSAKKWYEIEYQLEASNLYEAIQKTEAYSDIKGLKNLNTRYIHEDVPMGMVPIAALGRLVGVKAEKYEAIIKLAELIFGEELLKNARTLENLGIADMTPEELLKFVETGERN